MLDYSISSPKPLPLFDTFEITDIDTLFLDGHSLLSMNLIIKNYFQEIPIKPSYRPIRSVHKKEELIQNIDPHLVQEIASILQTRHGPTSKSFINHVTIKISELF